MIRKHLLRIFIICTVFSIFCAHSYALETESHMMINEYIARNTLNDFSLNSYLKDQLGFQEGIEETFNDNKVWKWIGKGGVWEDDPPDYLPFRRSVNHFHNPLTKQGFSGPWGNLMFLDGESALLWAQQPRYTQSPGGYYSWHDVRDYFYVALTSTLDPVRELYFAKTFRANIGTFMIY
jgi:hypothetical protein